DHLSTEAQSIDVAWAFSVFIHLPAAEIIRTMRRIAGLMRRDGVFFFSFVPEQRDERTGLKQFRHTWATWVHCAEESGFEFEQVATWPGEQRMARATRIV